MRDVAARVLGSFGGPSTNAAAQRLQATDRGPADDYAAVAALCSITAAAAASMVQLCAGGHRERAARVITVVAEPLESAATLLCALAGEHPVKYSTDDEGPRPGSDTRRTIDARYAAETLLREIGGPAATSAAEALAGLEPHRDYAAVAALASLAAQSATRLLAGALEKRDDSHDAHRLRASECIDRARRFVAAMPLPVY